MELKLKENKWLVLAWSSLAVAGTYILIDLYNKKRIRSTKLYTIKPEEDKSDKDSYAEVSSQMPEPLPTSLQRKMTKNDSEFNIHKICITGGPCAGKTTGLAYVAEKLREHDIAVFIVPEAATLIAQGGGMIKTGAYSDDDAISFQTTLLLTQCHLEETFMELALLAKQEAVILTDRGLMDGSAYMKPECWQTLMDEKGWNEVTLRDRRYDAVIHLVTAANGAAAFYNLGNVARYEKDLNIAIDVDTKIQNSWMGHPNFIIIDNKAIRNFEHKKNRLLSVISKLIGRPHTKKMRYKRRFILDLPENQKPSLPSNIKIKMFNIEETFLKEDSNPEDIIRVRKSYSKGYYTYIYSCKMTALNKETIKTKRQISQREYSSFLFQRDINRRTLKKERICFIGKSYFIIDTYLNDKPFSLLKIEVEDLESDIEFPESVKILREVTGVEEYRSYYLSNKQWLFPEADLKYFNVDR